MELGSLSVFRALQARMQWLNERQEVLAQNVANADTPNYQSRDLKPLDFRDMLHRQERALTLAVSQPGHIAAAAGGAAQRRASTEQSKFEANPTGNAVVLEEEMLKVGKTTHDYELMSNLYSKSLGMIKIALGRGGR
jgi:flagellar basal-body rod protein FlgB